MNDIVRFDILSNSRSVNIKDPILFNKRKTGKGAVIHSDTENEREKEIERKREGEAKRKCNRKNLGR